MPQVRVGWRAYVPTTYPTDTDATSFITAAAITNTEQQTAINTLVNELKLCGVWNKMKAIYPFVGGTAHAHKFNLKDPRDLNEAFRLTFSGGWTHSATGALPNGTTGYANTYLNPYVVFGNNQGLLPAGSTHSLIHVSKYNRTNNITTAYKAEGVYSNGGNQARYMFYGWGSIDAPNGSAFLNGWGYNQPYSYVTLGNRSDGFFVINRDGYASLKSFRNNTLISTNNTDIRAYNEIGLQTNLNANQSFLIGARNDAYDLNLRPYAYNDFEASFQSIGTSLTDAETSCYYNAVQKFQTMLNRQIGSAAMPSGQVEQLLETYSGSALAYSTRKIRGGYSGPAIRVRRSSDNAEQNIGFTAAGDLDTAALLAFTGTSNGFVAKWYDQSGNRRDIVQATANKQPQISINGIVLTEKGRPTVTSTGNSYLGTASLAMTRGELTSFAMFRMGTYRANMFIGILGGSHVAPSRNTTGANRYYGLSTGDTVFTPMANGNNYITMANLGGSISVWENGSQVVSNSAYASAEGMYAAVNLFDRWDASASLTPGTSISEVILYNSDQRSSRTAIEASSSAYFNAAYSTDSDATAFLSATGITSSTISSAINVMVKQLKSEGLWAKMKAIYPFVGGTATTHRFNLKDPRDLEAAFRLTPYGGITHDGGGASFNGTTGWYDTNMNAASSLSVSSLHLSFYSRTNNSNQYSGGEFGHVGYNSWTSPPQDYSKQLRLSIRNSQYAGSNSSFGVGNLWAGYSTTDGYGLTIGSVTSATSSFIRKGYGFNTSYGMQAFADKASATGTNTGSLPAYNICIGKTQGYGEYSQQQCAFASIGDGLSYDESAKLYGIVQIFQISLGRQV